MDLSPNDIRNFEFGTQMRGYDKDAVDNFKEQVAQTIELLKQENLRLSMEGDSVRVQLAGLKQFEDAIKNAAIDARRNADMTIANAKSEAELIVKRATAEVDQLLSGRTQRHAELETAIQKLELTRKSYLSKLRQLITSHLEWVQELAQAELPAAPQAKTPKAQEDRIEIVETTEMTARVRETIATEPGKQALARTEEANAASRIVPVGEQPTPAQVTAALKSVMQQDETPVPPRQIDPELASALENYRKVGATAAKHTEQELDVSTNKVKLAQSQPVEYTQITGEAPNTTQIGPDAQTSDLAEVLDKVVSKFEEEMDKAAKS